MVHGAFTTTRIPCQAAYFRILLTSSLLLLHLLCNSNSHLPNRNHDALNGFKHGNMKRYRVKRDENYGCYFYKCPNDGDHKWNFLWEDELPKCHQQRRCKSLIRDWVTGKLHYDAHGTPLPEEEGLVTKDKKKGEGMKVILSSLEKNHGFDP